MNEEPTSSDEHSSLNEQQGNPSSADDSTNVTPEETPSTDSDIQFEGFAEKVRQIKAEIGKVIIGQEQHIDMLLVALITEGHALVEGVPGIAKTLLANLLSKTLNVDFNRIQFTPDLMPSDITGTTVFNMNDSSFSFNDGPIFTNVVLIDEINRAPAKTQAALFEVMEEKQVTVDGQTYSMEFPFFVVATQNPLEQEGTYRLPEAQLDRFTFRLLLDYPNLAEEREILKKFATDFNKAREEKIAHILSPKELADIRNRVEKVHMDESILNYIASIVVSTRNHPYLYLGASPRASLAIMKSSKAFAALQGRAFVTPDDVAHVAHAVLNHRIQLNPEREMEGMTYRDVIEQILSDIEIPR